MKKLTLTTLLFFCVLHTSLGAQTMDSLYGVFRASTGDARIVAANEIFSLAHKLALGDTLFSVKNTDGREFVNATVFEIMGAYYDNEEGNYLKSIEFHKQAIAIYEKLGKYNSVNKLNGSIGTHYARMGDYENAVAYMMKNYEWETEIGDQVGLSSTFNNLGVVYARWGKREMALQFFEEAVKAERPLNRPLQYASRLAQLAREISQIDAERALSLIKEALQHNEQIEQQRLKEERIAVHTLIMGDVYFNLDSLEQAEKCYKKSLVFFENNARTLNVATTLLSLGRLQMKEKRWNDAILTLERCEKIAERNVFLQIQRDACRYLSEVYSRLEANTKAYYYLNKYTVINDSIFRETTQQQINDFQVRYETAEKQLEIERQQSKIEQHRTRQFILIGGLIAAGLLLTLLAYNVVLRARRNRALAEINATKDKFFSIISHDLKNPTLAQRNALQLLVDNAGKWDADYLLNYHQKLLVSANGLVELLKSLLNWAQTQTGHKIFYPSAFDLVVALQPDINAIKSMAERKGIVFETQILDNTVLVGDENMILAVIRNLLTNAIKFTEKGGRVTLSISPCKDALLISPCGDAACHVPTTWRISITDTGVGMPSEKIQNLFRLDRQTTQHGTAGETGVGLGLIVCKEFLELHNSHLHIESEEGKGSRFWFEIT